MAHSRCLTPAPQSPTFLLGKNARGLWVIRETHGAVEGLFRDRKNAIRFALYESGNRRGAVIATDRPLELESKR